MFVDLKFSIFKIQVSDYMNSKKNSAFQFSVSDFHLDTPGLTEHIFYWFEWGITLPWRRILVILCRWVKFLHKAWLLFGKLLSRVLLASAFLYQHRKSHFKTTSTKPFPSHVLWCPSTSNTRVVVILPYCGVLNLNNLFDAAV